MVITLCRLIPFAAGHRRRARWKHHSGDAPGAVNGNTAPNYPWYTLQGAEDGSKKIVYLSPQFAGVDFGVNLAPNNGNGIEFQYANASQSCPSLSSSGQTDTGGIPTDSFRIGNEIQAGVRYQGVVGPAITPAEPGVPGTKYSGQTKGISAVFVAADVTISGVTVGAAWQGGQYNGVMATSPKEAVRANAYLFGIQYVTGPFTIGAAYYGFDPQGAVALSGVSQRHENAFGAGGQWQITPGLQAY